MHNINPKYTYIFNFKNQNGKSLALKMAFRIRKNLLKRNFVFLISWLSSIKTSAILSLSPITPSVNAVNLQYIARTKILKNDSDNLCFFIPLIKMQRLIYTIHKISPGIDFINVWAINNLYFQKNINISKHSNLVLSEYLQGQVFNDFQLHSLF